MKNWFNVLMGTLVLVALILIIFIMGLQIGMHHGRGTQKELAKNILMEMETRLDILSVNLEAIDIMIKESGLKHDAKGKAGEKGIAQFKQKTFLELSKKAGYKNLCWTNPIHQYKLLVWALKNDYGKYWTTYKRVQIFTKLAKEEK